MVASQSPNMTDYEAERRSFQLEVPEYFNFATETIGQWARDSEKLAILWLGQHGEELSGSHDRLVDAKAVLDCPDPRGHRMDYGDPQVLFDVFNHI